MSLNITKGNAKTDGKDFGFWFMGTIENWCKEKKIPFDKEQFGQRNTDNIEIKWGMYKKNDVRDVWADSTDKTGMSILIRGDFTFIFREKGNNENRVVVRLHNEGDYVIWREDMEHTWRMDEDSEILTLRWTEK
jgi:cupin superfamily acireductone dioxygenase involved in methionine salvage